MKFATFIEAPQGGVDATQGWVKEIYAPLIVEQAPTLRGCVYRFGQPSPGTPFDAFAEHLDPDFGKLDVLIESWFSSAEDFRREIIPLEARLNDRSLRYASYHVTPRLQLDPRIAEAGPEGRRPGMTTVCAIRWKDGMPAQKASAYWARHAGIALREQKAITKYEQNVVEEVISWSNGVVPMDAFADFSHPTVEACRDGLVATREEMQDTSGFVGAGRFSYLGDAQPA